MYFDFEKQHVELLEILKKKGISDHQVLDAMRRVPRHKFVPKESLHRSYENISLPIGRGQTISRPYTVAFQTSLLQIKAGEKILEIGTGSGYQTAVLVQMNALVCTIERQKDLFDVTTDRFREMNIFPLYYHLGDGFLGLPNHAPFDKIILTAAAPFIPPLLKAQLKVGGRMVLPLSVEKSGNQEQKMISIYRKATDDFVSKEYETFSFVPMLSNIEGL